MASQSQKSMAKVMADLADEAFPPSKEDLYALSDLSGERLERFTHAWPGISESRRLSIMTELGELAEENFELDINGVSRAVLTDPSGLVRAAAIHNLWEDENADLIEPYLHTLANDPSPEARAAAASALGIFVYQGEMENLPAPVATKIEDALLGVFNSDDKVEVRRRALEAVGYSRRPEAAQAIGKAYASGDNLLKVSSLYAMGRSLDSERWGNAVLKHLADANPQVRYEAARAAGELQLQDAVSLLADIIRDVDDEVQAMGVWALGEIGGEEAQRLLQNRLRTAEGALAEMIDDALATAELMDDAHLFSLIEIDEDEDEEIIVGDDEGDAD